MKKKLFEEKKILSRYNMPSEMSELIQSHCVLICINGYEDYWQVPLIKIFNDELLPNSEHYLYVNAFAELRLFELGFHRKLDHQYVSHLLAVKEFLCYLPEWIDCLCLMKIENAASILPEIFALPKPERNKALDDYFNKSGAAPEHTEQYDGNSPETSGIWIDIDQLKSIDSQVYPSVMVSQSRNIVPLTKEMKEKLASSKSGDTRM